MDAIVEVDGHVMTVTLNRPARKNAMTLKMFGRMADAWKEASENDDIRVCILTGAEGNFSSGMDLRAMAGDEEGGGGEKIDAAIQRWEAGPPGTGTPVHLRRVGQTSRLPATAPEGDDDKK